MVSYTPNVKNKQAEVLSLCCFAAALLFYLFAGYLGARGGVTKALIQILALAIGAAGIHLLVRWGMTSYRYELHEDNLVVVRIVGKKELMVCNLTLKTALGLYPKAVWDALPEPRPKVDSAVNYVCSFLSENPVRYLYRDADRNNVIIFEPDDAFFAEMRARMTLGTPYEDAPTEDTDKDSDQTHSESQN